VNIAPFRTGTPGSSMKTGYSSIVPLGARRAGIQFLAGSSMPTLLCTSSYRT